MLIKGDVDLHALKTLTLIQTSAETRERTKVERLIKSHPEWKCKCLQCCKLKLQLRQIKTMSIAEVSRQIYENQEVLRGTRVAARLCQATTVKTRRDYPEMNR